MPVTPCHSKNIFDNLHSNEQGSRSVFCSDSSMRDMVLERAKTAVVDGVKKNQKRRWCDWCECLLDFSTTINSVSTQEHSEILGFC